MREPIQVPALLFAGENDIMPPEQYERGRWMFADTCQVDLLPGGHFMHRESPELFAKALLAFLGAG
ncbi:alpha/beta fold hydrolase [Haliangium ochraceum]|uniref:alpha/beta fold hydrolase n=1 Tax=Haliangium ochraceum TaxID=80816 RepID=UPI001E5ED0B6|nr:alpha/beta hydrolase [Haliangium ochraceum]